MKVRHISTHRSKLILLIPCAILYTVMESLSECDPTVKYIMYTLPETHAAREVFFLSLRALKIHRREITLASDKMSAVRLIFRHTIINDTIRYRIHLSPIARLFHYLNYRAEPRLETTYQ